MENDKKTCKTCRKEKPLDDFYFYKKGNPARQAICKICWNVRCREWNKKTGYEKKRAEERKKLYWENPLEFGLPNLHCRERHREFLYEYCKGKICVDCGTGDIRVFEFDHVRGEKLFDVGKINGRNIEKLKEEIKKCDIRCRNCHWIRTLRTVCAFKYQKYLFESDHNLLPTQNSKPYFDERTGEEKYKSLMPTNRTDESCTRRALNRKKLRSEN